MQLTEWCESYFRHKDILERKIEDIKHDGDRLIIRRKDGDLVVICDSDFSKISFDDTEGYARIYAASLHTKKNLSHLIDRWKELVAKENLMCVFADPESNTKWLVAPSSHDRIIHGDLKKGLKSLFDNCS